MATVFTSDTGKSIVRNSTVKIAVNHLSQISPEKAMLSFKALLIELFECFKMI
jgi:hypothetical protein